MQKRRQLKNPVQYQTGNETEMTPHNVCDLISLHYVGKVSNVVNVAKSEAEAVGRSLRKKQRKPNYDYG